MTSIIADLEILEFKYELYSLLSAVFFALATVIMAQGLKRSDSSTGVLISLYVNALIYSLISIIAYSSLTRIKLNPIGLISFILAGITGPYLGRITLAAAIGLIGSARAETLEATSTIFTVILAWLLINEKIDLITVTGIMIVVSGIIMIGYESRKITHIGPGNLDTSSMGDKEKVKIIPKGVLIGLISAFLYAITNILRKNGLYYIPSPIIGATIGVYAAAIFHSVGYFRKHKIDDLRKTHREALINFTIAGFCFAAGWWTYLNGLSGCEAGIASALKGTSPLWAVLFSRILLGRSEKIGIFTVFGAAIIVFGIILIVS